MKTKGTSIGKFEQGSINEDAVLARDNVIAVSDGAGGGGLFAESWSKYLLDHLPDTPIDTAEALDEWIGSIWEPFYNECEEAAKQLGGMSLEKFYNEGSFATLVAAWQIDAYTCKWISFGDSVVFHYNYTTRRLEHSFGRLGDFDEPPYLINCKDELNKKGFCKGTFHTDDSSVVFAASDALSHYIMMMYELSQKEKFAKEIADAVSHHSKNENYIRIALGMKEVDFEKDVVSKLSKCVTHKYNFSRHIQKVERQGLIAYDDYSFALMTTK